MIRTCDPRLRRPMLYPAELWALNRRSGLRLAKRKPRLGGPASFVKRIVTRAAVPRPSEHKLPPRRGAWGTLRGSPSVHKARTRSDPPGKAARACERRRCKERVRATSEGGSAGRKGGKSSSPKRSRRGSPIRRVQARKREGDGFAATPAEPVAQPLSRGRANLTTGRRGAGRDLRRPRNNGAFPEVPRVAKVACDGRVRHPCRARGSSLQSLRTVSARRRKGGRGALRRGSGRRGEAVRGPRRGHPAKRR